MPLVRIDLRKGRTAEQRRAISAAVHEAMVETIQIPPLDQLPKLDSSEASKAIRVRARELARQLRVRLHFDKPAREFTVSAKPGSAAVAPSSIS